ncbi:MAG: hypothetical protein NVSMB42_14080 [Herpetosiphon sp.]
MTLVFACIAPHGYSVIPELCGGGTDGQPTRDAMAELSRRCLATAPEVLVVATPHGTRVDGAIALAGGARAAGTLRWDGRQVEMNVPLDDGLTDSIVRASRELDVPVATISCGGNLRYQSANWLDWGALVPLWFLGYGQNMHGYGDPAAGVPTGVEGPRVVIAAPSRSLPRSAMVAFGRAIAAAAEADQRRIGFVASCDWAHTHAASGPYGFHPAAAEADGMVVAALRHNRPGDLLGMPDDLVANAAIDGLWQTLMLAGVLERVPMQGEVLSYEAPSYYGMIVAHWSRS